MSQPIMRRMRFGCVRKLAQQPAFGFSLPLTSLVSWCGTFSLLLLALAPAYAQTDERQARYSIESQQAVSNLLLDITQAGERLITVGDRGHILYSDDDGESWTQAKVPTRQMLTAVYFADEQHGWAVGHDALILTSEDAGETWTQQYENREQEAPLLDVWFGNNQHGIAVGAYGALLETTDGGNHWQDIGERLDNEDGYHLNAIAEIKGAGLFIVGELGGMFRSPDRGQTWARVESPYQGSFFGVVTGSTPGVVVAAGLRGHLYRSIDFGDSWALIEVRDNGDLLESGLAAGNLLADGRLVVVGHGGTVLSSHDQGKTFSLFRRSDRRSLSGVISNGKGNLILVGQGGVHVASPSGADLPAKKQ